MAAPAFLIQSQPFRPPVTTPSAYSLPIGAAHYDRDALNPVGASYAQTSPSISSVLIRRLPLNTSEESLRLMVVFSKELLDVEVLPAEQSDDVGFRSAILTFKTATGAQEARMMLDGKPNISNDADMIVEVIGGSPATGRRYAADSAASGTSASTNPSSAASSAASSRQAIRYNGTFQSLEKISPPMSSAFGGAGDLGNPESTPHYQNLFSPQSPIGNHLTERTRISGKTLINNGAADDDDETGELLKAAGGYSENAPLQQQRRATAPQLPISRMAALSLNTTPAPVPASMPPYGSMAHSMTSHSAAMSPPMMSGGPSAMPFGHHQRNHNFPPVNPADQNPPCNTLYVGNLPIDTSEEELKAMFSKQRGYKRLCFRTKQNGPMCFVEFEDVSFATKALHELYGHPLHNSVKGGIRLSFSKNPLGVRSSQNPTQSTPASISNGMSGMMSPNGFTTASGPPPGLSAPPGLGMGRLGYGGGGGGSSSSSRDGYSAGGYSGQSNNPWSSSSAYNLNGFATAAGPSSMMSSSGSEFQSPYMMGR